MPYTQESTKFDTVTPVQAEVLKALVEGLSITAAAERGVRFNLLQLIEVYAKGCESLAHRQHHIQIAERVA